MKNYFFDEKLITKMFCHGNTFSNNFVLASNRKLSNPSIFALEIFHLEENHEIVSIFQLFEIYFSLKKYVFIFGIFWAILIWEKLSFLIIKVSWFGPTAPGIFYSPLPYLNGCIRDEIRGAGHVIAKLARIRVGFWGWRQ